MVSDHPRCDKPENVLPGTLHFIVRIISETLGGSGEEITAIGLAKMMANNSKPQKIIFKSHF